MDKDTLGLILIMGIAGLVILAFVLNDAYGNTEYTTTYRGEFGGLYNVTTQKEDDHKVLHIIEQILEEEQKQTALLDHMDCMIFWKHNALGGITDLDYYQYCGLPLNYTGVMDMDRWSP